ncbi:hypothetical protein D3C79_800880 [compost metagenome]
MPDRFPAFFGDNLFFAGPQHDSAVFFDAVVIVAILADRDQVSRYTRIPGVGRHLRQVGVRLRIGDSDGLQAAINHVADRQQELLEDEWNIDEQLFFDFDQLVFVRQLKRHRYRFIGFSELFDDFFHGSIL